MQHSPITHLDPERFFSYIIDCCHEKEAAGEDPFLFDEMPCVVTATVPATTQAGSVTVPDASPSGSPVQGGSAATPTAYPHGDYFPTFANYHFKSLIKTEALTIYPPEAIDHTVISREQVEQCTTLLRNIDPDTSCDHYVIIAHTYTCQCCGQKVTDIIFTNNYIFDTRLFC